MHKGKTNANKTLWVRTAAKNGNKADDKMREAAGPEGESETGREAWPRLQRCHLTHLEIGAKAV